MDETQPQVDPRRAAAGEFTASRLVCVGLATTVIAATAAGIWVRQTGQLQIGAAPAATAVPVLAIAMGLQPLSFVVMRRVRVRTLGQLWADAAEAQAAADRAASEYVRMTIIGAALAEAMAMLGVVGYVLSGEWWLLAGSPAALLWLGLVVPTERRFRAFIAAVTRGGWS